MPKPRQNPPSVLGFNPDPPLFLTIDQGGHASRALIFDTEGTLFARSHHKLQTHSPQPGWVEHNAEALVSSVKTAIEDAVLQLSPVDRKRITAAGLATQRSTIACWHRKTTKALSSIISWQDRRSAEWMNLFQKERSNIHQRTGLFPSPHYGAGKLRWCLDHLPDVQAALKENRLAFGPLSSFLISRLTQESRFLVDPANASRTLLWNIHTKQWDDTLLDAFNLPLCALPETVPSRYPFGHIPVAGQQIPLLVVTGDQSAVLFQQGWPNTDHTFINIGTGAFIQNLQSHPTQLTNQLLNSIVFVDSTQSFFALEGTVNGAGSAVSWFSDQYKIDNLFEKADDWLTQTQNPLLFFNAVGGIGSPFWSPNQEPYFIGQGSIPERFTAVIESILFLIQSNLDEMNNINHPTGSLIVSGGISRLDGACQRLSDLSGQCLMRPKIHEATARGLLFLLSQNERPSPPDHPPIKFSPKNNTEIQNRYKTWKGLMKKVLHQK